VRQADDPTLWLIFHQRMLDAAEAVGQFATAREHAEAALAAAAEAADPFEVVRLLYKLAWTAYRMGNLEDARELAERGSRQAAAIADTEAMADFEYVLAVLAATAGDAAGTAEHARAAVAVYEEMGSIALVQVWNVQAAMHFLAGELPAAVLAYEETVAASRRAGTRAMEAIATANLAQALTCLGRYDEAEAALRDGERVAAEIGHLFVQHLLACFAGIVAYARGDVDEAVRRSRREVELADAIGSPEARARTTQTTAELALARGDAQEAARLAGAGLADHPSSEQGDATALLAAALAVAGDAEAAHRHAIAALQAPRPYAATLPQLAVWLAVALGGEDAAVLVPAATAAAAHMHLVLPVPILERLDLLTTSLHAALGGERCEALALEATQVPLAEVLDRLQARLAPDEGGSR
jgi:tetratricopeptide (TPR) repeat protein